MFFLFWLVLFGLYVQAQNRTVKGRVTLSGG